MKEITVLSGKGGTGKTTITAALASLSKNAVLCDNDVDAADLHLILKPTVIQQEIYLGAWEASIHQDSCSNCQICMDYCRFEAIDINEEGFPQVNSFKCEGCRLCERVCPENAIDSKQSTNNKWFISETRFGDMVHAQMGPGEENSGKLVSTVRTKSREIAREKGLDYIINDGPPGVGCSAISSISGVDLVVLVTEPTLSGLSDAKRLIRLAQSFNIPVVGVLNKADINKEVANQIIGYFTSENIPVLAQIPFNKDIVEAMILGKTVVEYDKHSFVSSEIMKVWKYIEDFKTERKNDYRSLASKAAL